MTDDSPGRIGQDPLRVMPTFYAAGITPSRELKWQKGTLLALEIEDAAASLIRAYAPETPAIQITFTHPTLARMLKLGVEYAASTANASRTRLRRLFDNRAEHIRVKIAVLQINWEPPQRVFERCSHIAYKREKADFLANSRPREALALYQEIISDIVDMHFEEPLSAIYRRVEYPIEPYTALLVQLSLFSRALQAIGEYQNFHDTIGIAESEVQRLIQRKALLEHRRQHASPAGSAPPSASRTSWDSVATLLRQRAPA